MKRIRITNDLGIYQDDDDTVLMVRDRESKDERMVCCALNKKELEKLIKELRP